MLSFLIQSYYLGNSFHGMNLLEPQKGVPNPNLAAYPFWIAHFQGENGLDKYDQTHGIRIVFIAIGAGVLGLLLYLRNRFLSFPIHPIGYLLILLSVYYEWISPYDRGGEKSSWGTSLLWGSALVAWILKSMIVKYGGMNTYKNSKPFFIGLIAGAVLTVFYWNMLDLICSILAESGYIEGGISAMFE